MDSKVTNQQILFCKAGVEELPTFSLKQYCYTLNSTVISLQLSDIFQNGSANENCVQESIQQVKGYNPTIKRDN